MTKRSIGLAVAVLCVVAACMPEQPNPSGSAAVIATGTPAPSGASNVPASPSAETSPSAEPTASAAPTSSPTPVPWKKYVSTRYKYSMKYPPTWVLTKGTSKYDDQYDDFTTHFVYVYRDTTSSGTFSLSKTIASTDRYIKSHWKAKRLTSKSIKLDGYPGRVLTYNGTENGRKVYIQEIILVKGRVAYFLSMFSDRGADVADRALFKKLYSTFNAKS